MTAKNYYELDEQIRQSTQIEEIQQILPNIDELVASTPDRAEDEYFLYTTAFRALKDMTGDDITKAEVLILNELLPRLERSVDLPTGAHVAMMRCREGLAEWLNQYPLPQRGALREKILDRLLNSLEVAKPDSICWTIAQIGLRRQDLVTALWNVVHHHDDESGDIALDTIVDLGVPPEQRSEVLAELHQRAAFRRNVSLMSAVRDLADPSSIQIVLKHWLSPAAGEAIEVGQSFALSILPAIADAFNSDQGLQDSIWQTILDLFERDPEHFSFSFYLGAGISSQCNSPKVIPDLVRWLNHNGVNTQEAIYHRFLLYHRMEECIRPEHLRSWESLHDPGALLLMTEDACQDTKAEGRGATQEWHIKELAWKTLLLLGYREILSLFNQGIVTETNRYFQGALLELLACLQMDPLPDSVVEWLTTPFDVKKEVGPPGEAMLRLRALTLARSSASREAFNALRRCEITIGGMGVQDTVQALAEVSIALVQKGDLAASEDLIKSATESQKPYQRTAAAAALEQLAAEDLLPSRYALQVEQLLGEESRTRFERSLLVAILGHLKQPLTPTVIQQLEQWASTEDDWLTWRSCETLARHGFLSGHQQLLKERFRLQQRGEQWELAPEGMAKFPRNQIAIMGLLYQQQPDVFAPAVVSLLQYQDGTGLHPLLWSLQKMYVGKEKTNVPEEMSTALLERLTKREARVSIEDDVIDFLAQVIGSQLAEQPWPALWSNWHPDTRAALARVLGEVDYTEAPLQSKDQAIAYLLLLTQDGQYRVRQAAYRGLSRLSHDSLLAACLGWAYATSTYLRQRAAEAWAWLPPDTVSQDEIYRLLSSDEELLVRETSKRAREEQRKRLWAMQYTLRLVKIKEWTNEEVLATWRYGQALAQLGDEQSIKALTSYSQTQTLPPHVDNFLRQIRGQIRKSWRKMMDEWPKPWDTWSGTLEESQGYILLPSGLAIQTIFSFWRRTSGEPTQDTGWGGAILWKDPVYQLKYEDTLEFWLADYLPFQLVDGRKGEAHFRRLDDIPGAYKFLGRGHYPTK